MCTTCTCQPIPPLEMRWRSIATLIKTQAAAAGAAVNFVDVDASEEREFISGSELKEFLA